ncbi:MAG: alcohol dehydrogenase catalytic domain-containing protein [Candidatus Eremiobacteraeota bacterium]|nr:alcohol dehydrogenase catalytic domain-containing protein [Candidatus Eremiobacteraeota bacterium]
MTTAVEKKTMQSVVLEADWEPVEGYVVSDFEKETGKAITGSSIWRNPRLSVKEVKIPEIKPDQVLIKIKACGVCGSDIHFHQTDENNYMLYPGLTKFPTIIGHEFSGIIEEVGPEVKNFKIGDMVTAEEMIWCGECIHCRNGFPNQCLNLEEIGFTINGSMAEYIAIGAKYCWKLNAIMDRYHDEDKVYELGATVEPSSVAYNGMFEIGGGFRPGAFVTIYGTGPIGLACCSLAKIAGAARVIAFEVSGTRRKLAKDMGADYVYDPVALEKEGKRPSDIVMELTGGEGANFQVETAGAPTLTIPEMERAMAVNSTIIQIGRAAHRVSMYLEQFQVKRGHLHGAQGHSGHGNFPNVIRLMAAGLLDTTKMITSRYNFEEIVNAINPSASEKEGKMMLKI